MKLTKAKTILSALLCLTLLAGCSSTPAETEMPTAGETEPTVMTEAAVMLPEATEPRFGEVDLAYLTVMLPEASLSRMTRQEVREDSVVMEVFSMDLGEEQLELFRIFFGGSDQGKPIGFLETEAGDLAVSMTAGEYPDDVFPDEESRLAYYELMDSLNRIVQTIQADPRFHSEQKVRVETAEAQVAQWNFDLPDTIEWEEVREAGGYRVNFFTQLNGERLGLYRFAIGGEALQTVLGTYLFEGREQELSIDTYPLPSTEGWPEETVTSFYRMMESINDVIHTLMSGEDFREPQE